MVGDIYFNNNIIRNSPRNSLSEWSLSLINARYLNTNHVNNRMNLYRDKTFCQSHTANNAELAKLTFTKRSSLCPVCQPAAVRSPASAGHLRKADRRLRRMLRRPVAKDMADSPAGPH